MDRLFALVVTLFLLAGPSQAQESWVTQPNMIKPRAEATAIVYMGKLYVFNGFGPNIKIENSVEQLDPSTGQWTLLGTTSTALGNAVTHNGMVLHGQDVWLIGGRIGDHPGKVSNKVWIYNIGSKQWRQGPVLPAPFAGGGAALVNNKIYLFGGLDGKAQCDVNRHLVLDLSRQNAGWQDISQSAAMPVARNHFATAIMGDSIYAIGGQFGHDACPGLLSRDTRLVHRFDTQSLSWTRIADLPDIQSHAEPSTFVYNGFIYSVGGQIRGSKIWRYNPADNSWTQTHTLTQPLLAPVARVLNGKLVVAGGGAPNTLLPTNKVISLQIDEPDADQSGDTQQHSDPLAHSTITVEAEDFDLRIGTATHQWVETTLPAANGSLAMVTTPDKGTLKAGTSGSPVLSYQVNFERPGLHYLWIRGWGDTNASGEGKSDSVHAGLNGVMASSADKIDVFPSQWSWSQSTRDRVVATLMVPDAGLHSVDLWMREDGLAIDKFLLTTDAGFTPQGSGPADQPAINQRPVVNAGADAGITLGQTLTLVGQVRDDGLPQNLLNSYWSAVAGPGTASFTNPGQLHSSVSFSEAGRYELKLAVSDGVLSGEDTVLIDVEQPASDPIEDTGLAYIAIEAEDYDSISASSSHHWVDSTLPGASNGAAMVTTPDRGVLQAGSANSPMLSYLVYFEHAGTHYLWVRGWGDTNAQGEGKSDSIHAGLNGVLASSADKIDQFPSGWNWSRNTRDKAVATLTIPSAGMHVVNLWMREDGFAVDKIILSSAAAYRPSDEGPASTESDDGQLLPEPVSNTAPAANAGADQTVDFGELVQLHATVSDDGNPHNSISALWQKKSGPGTVTFGDTSLLETSVSFSSPGLYILRLSASDGQLSDDDLIGIRVLDELHQPGVIDAHTAWSFLQTSNGSRVTERHEAGAVAVNGKIYMLGGRGNKPVQSFDPSTRSWTSHGRAPLDMHHFQPVALNNKIYVIGALKNGGYPQEQAVEHIYEFNVLTHTWSKGISIPSHRRRGSAGAAIYNNKIYIVGGNRLGHDGPAVNWLDEYDPATRQWKALPNAPHARDHITVAVADSKLVVAAGRRSNYPNVFGDTEAATDIYNFSTGSWGASAAIPTKRAGAMTVAAGSEVVVIGGESLASGVAHNNVESLNVITGQWRRLQPLSLGRHSGGAAVLDNRIHVISGNTSRGGGNEVSTHETLAIPAQ